MLSNIYITHLKSFKESSETGVHIICELSVLSEEHLETRDVYCVISPVAEKRTLFV